MSQQKEQNMAATKDDIITMTANKLFENIVLFFMSIFVLLCSSNTSSTPIEIQIHHLILPQQHKALYNIIKNYSSKQQDSHQPLGITNHQTHQTYQTSW